jgi:hypothetical protein
MNATLTHLKQHAARAGERWPDLVLAAGTLILLLVCLFLLGVPAYQRLHVKAQEAAIKGNAATLQLAAESYAAANLGRYPEDVLDLLPYLPGDHAPANPYTGAASLFKGEAGDLTYRSPTRGRDYVIQAWGRDNAGDARLIMTLKGRAPRSRS